MKKYYLAGIVIVVVAAVVIFAKPSVIENSTHYQAEIASSSAEESPVPEVQEISGPRIVIGSTTVPVEVVRTKAETEKGLSGRLSLPENDGMLFIFPNSQIYSFWMPDMHFNLDIIWINNGRIVDITKNASRKFDPQNPIFYRPKFPARYILEVNAGFADRHGIKVGEKVSFIDIDL